MTGATAPTARIAPRMALLLCVPPLMWAGNAMVGRLLAGSVPPLALNAMRWWLALAVLLLLAWRVLADPARRAAVWARRAPLAWLGLSGVGLYNALQYLALTTSTPINVTLIASSTPVWTLAVGALFFGERPRRTQLAGAALSLLGVLVVLTRGDWQQLAGIRLVSGDLWMLVASISWAFYGWQLARPHPLLAGPARPAWSWSEALLVQVLFGIAWASLGALGEAALAPQPVAWSWGLAAALLFVALGPSLLAYRCWGLGVEAVGPTVASFFANLTPLFAALMSAALLGQPPQAFHALAFALIVAGIWVSSRQR